MANGFQGPPAVDFYSQLSGLGDVIAKNRADQAKRDAFAQATTPGPDGTVDYGRAVLGLAQVDPQSAALFAARQNHEDQLKQQAAAAARQAERDKVTDSHWSSDYSLRKAAAARADEGPVEQAGYREAVARKYGLDPASPEGRAFIVSGKLPDSVANGGTPEVGLQPAYGTGPDGKVGAIQFSKTGKAVQTQLPEGFNLSKEPMKVDMGTHIQLIDPITRQPIGPPISKNLAGVEREKAVGEATGAAEVALPQVIANSDALLKTLDGIDKHPGKKYSLGMYSKAPTIPGTSQADFRARLEQLQGQGFLQAYQTLKGGGAITDIEGTKGTNALMRMQTAQTEESFNQGLKDFKEVVQAGADRARAKARGAGSPSAEQPAAAPADPLGIR